MKCDELRASRIYDSLRHRLKADPSRRKEFIIAMGEGVEVFEFKSAFGMSFRFVNRDSIWAVGFDLGELLGKENNREIFLAVQGMNEMCLSYLQAHYFSGLPGPSLPPDEREEILGRS